MKEEYLHYAFKSKLFGRNFSTQKKQSLKIIDFGEHNQNAGPDFLDAKVSYDGQTWCGPIEFHVNASDWYKHQHHTDRAFDNVIAHFVYNNDREVSINNYVIPTVELKEQVDPQHFMKYRDLIQSGSKILCKDVIGEMPRGVIENQKMESIKTRLWHKSVAIVRDIEANNGDQKKAFLLAMARVFGGKVNQMPMEQLIERLNMRWLRKLNGDQDRADALLFGLAGILPKKSKFNYVKGLIAEFNYAKNLFGIDHVPSMGWKYSRMRPGNFPDIRLAQLSTIINADSYMPNFKDKSWSISSYKSALRLKPNPFWQTHYRIANTARDKRNAQISNQLIDLFMINAVVPFIYAIGLLEGNKDLKEKAIQLLHEISPEQNKIISEWKSVGLKLDSAFDSQSLIELKNHGCNRKKCLFCAIGKSALKR